MNPIAAIWHHPGAPPNRQGAGDYPIVILSFLMPRRRRPA
jgi:hypothetical protein